MVKRPIAKKATPAKKSTRRRAAEPDRPIGDRVRQLLMARRPMTYDEVLETVLAEYPDARTSRKSIQWYASRLRAEGKSPTVRRR